MTDITIRRSNLSVAKRSLLEARLRGAIRIPLYEDGIPLRHRRDSIPLSFAQQRLWFLDQLVPNSPLYNITGMMRLEGRLDIEALEATVNEIVRRHEVLRTRFEVNEGRPVQVIDAWEPRRLEVEDLTRLTGAEKEAEVRRGARKEAETGFDLKRGPLLRVKVLKVEPDEHLLIYTMHHIVSDGWSMEILSREVGALYKAYSAGEPSPLEELEIQYADFAVWQRKRLQGEALERELGYWRNQLAGMEALELSADHPRPAAPSYRGGVQSFVVGRELAEKLRELGRREGVTLFMTLLGGFDFLMSRYSGQADVALGTDIANRNRAEIEGLIGFFVNHLVLRVEVRARESFSELLKKVREVCLGAYAHQGVPFEKLVEELQPERDLNRNPLFNVAMTLQNAGRETLVMKGVKLSGVSGAVGAAGEAQAAKIDLTLSITDLGHELAGAVEYSRDLFEAGTIERLINHYKNVLDGAVKDSEKPISELNLLSDQERAQVILEWNETASPYPEDQCVHELFERQVERTPEAVAVVFKGGCLSYGELNRRANQLGRRLRELGVGPEVVVGLCLERSVEMVVGLLGALKAGGAYLPLDPAYPAERLNFMLEDAAAQLIVTQEKLGRLLGTPPAEMICIDGNRDEIVRESEENIESGVESENLAYVIYTSGSTGRPKGTMITHRSVVNLVTDAVKKFRLEKESKFLQFASLSFDVAVEEIYPVWSIGGAVVLQSDNLSYSYSDLEKTIERHEVTTIELPTVYWREWMRELSRMGRRAPRSLDLVITGDARISPEIMKEWKEHEVQLLYVYGVTEATVNSIVYPVPADFSDGASVAAIPIGSPMANTEVYLLDERLEPMPLRILGEMYLGGVGLARGYLNRPELTAERFVPSPYGKRAGSRLYKSGDVARRSAAALDGALEFIGRIDHQVKIRGFRVELGEIEAALDEHGSVKQSVVIANEDEGGGKRLIGYVVGGEGATESSLKRHVRERLPEYMVPESIVLLEEMPLTANGKIDRKRLRSVKGGGRQAEQEYAAPRTPAEEILAGIFAEVLKLERVGIRENFFELGGHSLLATQVMSRVRSAFGVEIRLRSIFEAATVEGLTRRVEEAMRAGEKDEAPPLAPVSRDGRGPLSYAQQRLWFIDQLNPGNAVYNVPGGVRLYGSLNLEVLEKVINEIVRRHEVLRTRIEVEEGEPVQVIDQWEPRRLEWEDLTDLAREEREDEVRRIAREEARKRFDLSRGPLLRVKVLKLEEDENVLLYTMHHIVSDEWSMGILIREVGALYRAYILGEESPLEELPIQYADYAVWQREYLESGMLEREVGYWKEQLQGAAVMELPADHARPAAPTHRGGSERIELKRELSEELRRLSRREGATLFMALMAAFKVLLMRYSGEEDVSIGTAIANRTRKGVEGLIGFFVNTLVMRTDLSGNPSFRELIRREREVALGGYDRQEAPFEKLVEEINPQRDLSRSPLFQVMMALQNAGRETLELPGVKLSGVGGEVETGGEIQTAKFDLTLTITDLGQELAGAVEYSRDLFEAGTIERLISHYANVLDAIVKDSERPISELSLLSEAERRRVVEEWNATEASYPREKLIHELFEEQVERSVQAVALVCGEQSLTYGELNARANRLAHRLRALGVEPGMRVALLLERSVDLVVAQLAALKSGAAYVPIDPNFPDERQALIATDCEARVVITAEKITPPEALDALRIDIDDLSQFTAAPGNPNLPSGGEMTAYVMYTSGSSGRPKGVMISHRAIGRLVLNCGYADFESGDRVAFAANPAFDAATMEVWAPLLNGGRIVVVDQNCLLEPLAFARALERYEVSVLWLTVGLFNQYADPLAEVCGALRYLIVGGDVLDPRVIARVMHRSSPRHLINGYGPTETTTFAITHEIAEIPEGLKSVPLGRPISNTQIYILEVNGQPAPIGVTGELYIGGEGVAQGYLNRPELTAERFVPDPFGVELGARLYKTGDLGRWLPVGEIEFLGRADYQVKIRGFRIELGEIETRLMNHPEVREAVAQAREDGAGGKRLVAYYTGEDVGAEALRSHLLSALPEYMAPAAYVWLERLPLTPNGKLDRRALPAPEGDDFLRRSYEPPVGEMEIKLAQIWAELLKLEQVGRHDNFFELGGHSLLISRLLAKIDANFEFQLPVRSLFQAPTIAELAEVIDTSSHSDLEGDELSMADFAEKEAVLDPSIRPKTQLGGFISDPENLFLTGATGFVGAFLLGELLAKTSADIYCLVRAASIEEGAKRLQLTLKNYLLWNDSYQDRIIPILGDLSQPLLGIEAVQFNHLASKIDVIYHSGAHVNFIYPYSALKAANVIGTQEALRLACEERLKPVHHISTLSVFNGLSAGPIMEQAEPGVPPDLNDGYSLSKWVAERLVSIARDRGIPASIYRLGRITGQSQTGASSTNDLFFRMIRGCIELGSVPYLDMAVDIVPVDYVSRAIIHLSRQETSAGRNFHLNNIGGPGWNTLVSWIRSAGYHLEELAYNEWVDKLKQAVEIGGDNSLIPLLPIFRKTDSETEAQEGEANMTEPDRGLGTTVKLALAGISCPTVHRGLIDKYLDYFMRRGFLERPEFEAIPAFDYTK